MLRRSFLSLATVLVLPLSALTVSSAASAIEDPVSRVVLRDPTGDVWAIAEGEDEKWVSAGDVPTADVVRAVVSHRRYHVVVKMTFTNLRRVEPQSYTAMIFSRRQYGAVFVSAGSGRWAGRHVLVDGDYSRVRCPKLSHSINYNTEQVTISVPRGCIGRPTWIRASLSNIMFRGDSEKDFREITDNPHSAGAEGGFTRRLYRAVG